MINTRIKKQPTSQATNKQQTSNNKQEQQELKNNKNTTVVFEKSMITWFRQQGKTDKYAYWLLKELDGDMSAVRKAWSKSKSGHSIVSVSQFVDLCKTFISS